MRHWKREDPVYLRSLLHRSGLEYKQVAAKMDISDRQVRRYTSVPDQQAVAPLLVVMGLETLAQGREIIEENTVSRNNDNYKRICGAIELSDTEVFEIMGGQVSKSKLNCWRRKAESDKFQVMRDEEFDTFCENLIGWMKSQRAE